MDAQAKFMSFLSSFFQVFFIDKNIQFILTSGINENVEAPTYGHIFLRIRHEMNSFIMQNLVMGTRCQRTFILNTHLMQFAYSQQIIIILSLFQTHIPQQQQSQASHNLSIDIFIHTMKSKNHKISSLAFIKSIQKNKKIHEKVLRSQEIRQLKEKISLYLPHTSQSPKLRREESLIQKNLISPRSRAASEVISTNLLAHKNSEMEKKRFEKKLDKTSSYRVQKINLSEIKDQLKNPSINLSQQKKRCKSEQTDLNINNPSHHSHSNHHNFHKYLKLATVKEIFETIQKQERQKSRQKYEGTGNLLLSKKIELKQIESPSFQEEVRQKMIKFRSKNPIGMMNRKRTVHNVKQLSIKSNKPLTTRYGDLLERKQKINLMLTSRQPNVRKRSKNSKLAEFDLGDHEKMMGWTKNKFQIDEMNEYLQNIREEEFLKTIQAREEGIDEQIQGQESLSDRIQNDGLQADIIDQINCSRELKLEDIEESLLPNKKQKH